MSSVTCVTSRFPDDTRNHSASERKQQGARSSSTPARASRAATHGETPPRRGGARIAPESILALSHEPAPTRYCRRGEHHQPAWSFVLADDPDARDTARGIRLWCGDCLFARSHITRARLDAAYAAHAAEVRRVQVEAVRASALDLIARIAECVPPVLDLAEGATEVTGDRYEPVILTDKQRQTVVDRAREHAATNALIDAAHDDPVIARAMRRALDTLRAQAREQEDVA